jgi:hypothetical protein
MWRSSTSAFSRPVLEAQLLGAIDFDEATTDEVGVREVRL